AYHKIAIAQQATKRANLGCGYIAGWQQVAAHHVGNGACVDSVVLLLCGADCLQHRRMCYLQTCSVGFQRVVNPPAEQGRFHSSVPRLPMLARPFAQHRTLRNQPPFLINFSIGSFAAEIDVFLVYVESDIVSDVHWVLLLVASESALSRRSRHSSPSENPSYFSHLCIQTDGTFSRQFEPANVPSVPVVPLIFF